MLPVLARIGPITIGTHDFFTILGLLVGLSLYYRALRRERMLSSQIMLISVAAILGGAIGARLITGWEAIDKVQAAGLPLTYILTHGPKSIIGGLAGDEEQTVQYEGLADEPSGPELETPGPSVPVTGTVKLATPERPIGSSTNGSTANT